VFAAQVPGSRRLSQRISEGDGIAIIVCVADAAGARDAEEQGAKAVAVHGTIDGIRDATTLPLLWIGAGTPKEADAVRIRPDDDAGDQALEAVVDVRDEEELELALERLDPEIFLLAAGDAGEEGPLERTLDLLQDVPAGKLAIAELAVRGREEVAELERAGMDAVIVPAGDVAELVGGSAPEV
jgi:hypothetical protein